MIVDFLQIYVQKGVFALDYEHRHRVSKEGRNWANISGHDKRMFLKHFNVSSSVTSPTSTPKPKTGRTKGRFQKWNAALDAEGTPFCFHYNGKGCSYAAKCIYSHVFMTSGCGQKHSQNVCPKAQQS